MRETDLDAPLRVLRRNLETARQFYEQYSRAAESWRQLEAEYIAEIEQLTGKALPEEPDPV